MREDRLEHAHASTEESAAESALEKRLIRALETAPEPLIPDGFAALVASRLPAARPAEVTQTRYGYNAIRLSMAALPLFLVAVSAHAARGNTVGLALQWTLCAQFAGIAIWLGTQRTSLR
jgi:hypothetical protein